MRDLTPFWFTPDHQPSETPVEFHLRPLDLRTLYTLQASFHPETGRPDWNGISAVFEYAVTDWRGLPQAFDQRAKRAVLDGAADHDWLVWVTQIAGQLYSRSLLSEDARKNS